VRPGLEGRIDEAVAAGAGADTARYAGDFERAARLDRDAERLITALVADDPDEPAHRQALGSRCYMAGESLLAAGEPRAAVEVLGRAYDAYQALGALPAAGFARDQVELWVADVQLRRARGLLLLDHLASALAESQAAAFAYLRRWDGTGHHPLALDTARVLAWHAYLTSRAGDPDVAVGAADTALRVYLGRADDVNASVEGKTLHLPTFALAARVAAVVHDAHGRDDLAASAAEMGSVAVPTLVPWPDLPTTNGIRAALTLAEALDRAGDGADPAREALTAPAVECRILTPADRCAPDLLPAWASTLARLAAGDALAGDPAAARRLALEAHALFAHASAVGVPAMRHDGFWIAEWLDLARRASEAAYAEGRVELAVDLSRWMSGSLAALGAHVATDAGLRATARRGVTWYGRLMGAAGDEAEARAARAGLDHLDELEGGP
jgi:hypothetical protein